MDNPSTVGISDFQVGEDVNGSVGARVCRISPLIVISAFKVQLNLMSLSCWDSCPRKNGC